MKTHHRIYAVAVLLLVSEAVHAQLTETMPGVYVDMDTVVVSPAQKWFVDSFLVAREIKQHEQLLVKYQKMPDRYFDNLNKRLQPDHKFIREDLIAYEKERIALAKAKLPIYRKAFENTLTANK